MKKLIKSAVGMLAVLMLIACGESKTNDVSTNLLENNETIEIPSKPVSEPQKENDGKDVIESVDNELEEVTKEVVFLNVKSSEDAIANIIAEGTDKDEYLSAKDYIEKVKARGMGDTLADTLAVFNRCGFEYCGYDVSDLEMSLWKDDDFSEKVIITADGDILYYLRTGYSGRANDLKSGYQDYKLWRINDDKQYEIVKYDSSVGYRLFTDYYDDVTEVNRDVEPSDFEYCKILINGSYIDVNGDNKKDRLLWGWEDCFSLNVYVQLADGPEISLNHEGQSIYYEVCYIDSVYLGNCLMTSDYGDSDDACTHMYTISGNDCISHGSVYVYPQEIKFYNDHIVAGFRGYHISTEEIRTDYILDANGEFVEHSDGFYEYRGNTVKALVDIQTFATNDETTPGIIISKNSDLVFLGGDLEKWIKVRDVKSDTECWLMTNGEDIVFPDGTQIYAFEAMEGIIIYD